MGGRCDLFERRRGAQRTSAQGDPSPGGLAPGMHGRTAKISHSRSELANATMGMEVYFKGMKIFGVNGWSRSARAGKIVGEDHGGGIDEEVQGPARLCLLCALILIVDARSG